MKGTSNNSLLGHSWESPTEEPEGRGQDHVGGGTETWGGTTIVVGGVKTALLASVGSCTVCHFSYLPSAVVGLGRPLSKILLGHGLYHISPLPTRLPS